MGSEAAKRAATPELKVAPLPALIVIYLKPWQWHL
jgi:hypothetical protein